MTIRPLGAGEVAVADARLPLSRLDQPGGEYLVAWEDEIPVGHAFVDWRQDPPELQDVFVLPERRRRGIAAALTAAAEDEARSRGHRRLLLSVSTTNDGARRLYQRLGFVDAGREPTRVCGTILLRGEPVEVDDTLVYLVKQL